jgi:hypothetical protein
VALLLKYAAPILSLSNLFPSSLTSFQQLESRREKKKVEDAVNNLPKTVHKTIKDMHAQGVPKDVIAEKIRLSSKGTSAQKVVEGVLKEDPWKTEKANKEAKRRQTKLKNEVKRQQKQERKKSHREL